MAVPRQPPIAPTSSSSSSPASSSKTPSPGEPAVPPAKPAKMRLVDPPPSQPKDPALMTPDELAAEMQALMTKITGLHARLEEGFDRLASLSQFLGWKIVWPPPGRCAPREDFAAIAPSRSPKRQKPKSATISALNHPLFVQMAKKGISHISIDSKKRPPRVSIDGSPARPFALREAQLLRKLLDVTVTDGEFRGFTSPAAVCRMLEGAAGRPISLSMLTTTINRTRRRLWRELRVSPQIIEWKRGVGIRIRVRRPKH